MGVYHLMGLGRSPGVVIGPISYLASRYKRWDKDDVRFFSRSGEAEQRKKGEKVGDIQAIILFTTKEIISGELKSFEFIDNTPPSTSGKKVESKPMKDVLNKFLKKEWEEIRGGRSKGKIFWCEVDRRNIKLTYSRVIQVVATLAGVGGQGKEMWVNLTGGNNVINFALQMAATLSGEIARMYYIQAEDEKAEKCIRYTSDNGYWVELPVLPLSVEHIGRAIIDELEEPQNLVDIYSKVKAKYHNDLQDIKDKSEFKRQCLAPLWKLGLITEVSKNTYSIGPQWEIIKPYMVKLEKARDRVKEESLTIEKFAGNAEVNWIEIEEIYF